MPPLYYPSLLDPPRRQTSFPMAPSTHPESVVITLRSTRPGPTTNLTRNVTLYPDEPVNVGRSSRSEAKNLSATPNNALFDCPVISRRHAELELRVNKWTEEKHHVYIKDTGSTHGTSVNGQKLQPSKPFQLQKGDMIRLGESVNRADSNYDGVTVILDSISTATKKDTTQVKSSQEGIRVPSDSESEFDDEDNGSDGGADLHPSSAHTTPDQLNDKLKPQSSLRTGSSPSNGIMVEDDDDDEPVQASKRRAFPRLAIPDTYADEDFLAPLLVSARQRYLHDHDDAQPMDEIIMPLSSKARSHLMKQTFDAEGSPERKSLNDEQPADVEPTSWSEESNDSYDPEESDAHSESHEDFDRQSFLSEEFNMADDVEAEDDEDDEGPPEIMSSKRRLSNELGTLGDEQTKAMPEIVRDNAIPARPHYDPVRGFQVPSPSVNKNPSYRSYGSVLAPQPFATLTNSGYSAKWDIQPPLTQSLEPFNPFGSPETQRPAIQDVYPLNNTYTFTPSLFSIPPAGKFNNWDGVYEPVPTASTSMDFIQESLPTAYKAPSAPLASPPSEPIPPPVENNTKKRKAPEMDADEPVIISQVPATSEEIDEVAPAVVASEPQAKKRKTQQSSAQNSMLRTAVIEAGKYTAGAIIGGIGLVTLLASPIGEALASC